MQPHGTCDTGGDSDAMKPLDSTAHRGRPGRGRLRSLAARGLKVTDVSVTPGDKQLVVEWKAVDTGAIKRSTTPVTSFTISGLTNDAEYTVRVHATGADAIGAWSEEMTGKSEGARG